MTKILKVDRVRSVAEASELQSLGVSLISVSMYKNPRYDDERLIGRDTAIAIRESIRDAKYVCETDVSGDPRELIGLIRDVGFDYLQVNEVNMISDRDLATIKSEGIEVIHAYVDGSHDTRPEFVMGGFEHKQELDVAYFQIDAVSDYTSDGWNYLKNEALKYPDYLMQIEDFEEIAKEWPTIMCLNYSPDNVSEILTRLPSIKGIGIVLAESSPRQDLHYFNFSEAKEILRAVPQLYA